MKKLFCFVLSVSLCISIASVSFSSEEKEDDGFIVKAGMTELVSPDTLTILSSQDVDTLNEKMENYVPSDDTLILNDAVSYYYYDNIDPIEREIYDILYMIALDPVEDNIGVMMTDIDPSSDEFLDKFYTANFALLYDHAELFWLYQCIENYFTFGAQLESRNGTYVVYFSLDSDYLNYEKEMTEFNNAVNDFLSTIDRDASEYDIARQIHDKLIDLASYNTPVSANESEGQNLAHTAYGALVQDSYGSKNLPVCDGYSQAYLYLLQQCGIEGVFIGGMAGPNSFSLGGHAWNVIKIDGVWYEVDSTWDDYELDTTDLDYCYVEAWSDSTYRNIIEHRLFMVSTASISNFNSDQDEYKYITKDGAYIVTLAGDSIHERLSSSDTDSFTNKAQKAVNALMDLAPIAESDCSLNW